MSSRASDDDLVLDTSDPTFRDRPHDILDVLRAERPAVQDRARDRVVVTRACDVAAVLADRSLSHDPFKARPTAFSRRSFTPEDRGALPFYCDDPDHARIRGLVVKAFAARAVEAMRPMVETRAAEALDAIDPSRPFDVVASYADPFPISVMASLLGVADADLGRFKALSNDLRVLTPALRTEERMSRRKAAREEFARYFASAIEARRRRPHADLIGALVAAQDDGRQLGDDEIGHVCRFLLVAGNVTTTEAVGNGVVALLRQPDQLARLRAAPELWPDAVEEVLRYDPPLSTWNRQALHDTEVGGCPVEAGQTVSCLLLAANHDPALHRDPHVFDIDRDHQQHFTFGGGAHFCLGASLARLEVRVALSGLFRRFPKLRLVENAPPRKKDQPAFSGYESILADPT